MFVAHQLCLSLTELGRQIESCPPGTTSIRIDIAPGEAGKLEWSVNGALVSVCPPQAMRAALEERDAEDELGCMDEWLPGLRLAASFTQPGMCIRVLQ